MMQNLKYGILTGGGYIVAAAAIALLACIINSAAGEDNALFLTRVRDKEHHKKVESAA